LKIIGGLGASAAALSLFSPISLNSFKSLSIPQQTSENFKVVRSVCLQCHSGCGIQVTIADPGTSNERAINIGGNPYHPNTGFPNLNYSTDPESLVDSNGYPTVSGKLCAKGRSGLQTLYDPQRIKHPLKRVGPRGAGEWEVISWDQALSEITGANEDGTNHNTRSLPVASGSGTYTFDGLKQIRTDNPNKFVFMVGRSEHGRKELTDRIWKDGYGTKNHRNDHTSICELSHHAAFALAFGGKTHVGTDIMNAEFILWMGTTSPLEAGFPMLNLTARLMAAKNPDGINTPLKMVVVDPRFSRTAAKADMWLPVRPGADAALACGMMAFMVNNGWYDESNVVTAKAGSPKEFVATDATHLVITQNGHTNEKKFLTATDANLGNTQSVLDPDDPHVVLVDDIPTSLTFDDDAAPASEDWQERSDVVGDLGDLTLNSGFKTTAVTVNGIECKTVFQLYWEKLWEPIIGTSGTIDDLLAYYADECGEYVSVTVIKDLATEFWKHGKKSVCNFYRGSVQHTNGTYTALALINLNFLVGNIDRRGGMTTGGSHWHETGSSGDSPYLSGQFGGVSAIPTGLNIAREKESYADAWLGGGSPPYPAERPFFNLTSNVWQEVIAGIRHGEGDDPVNTGFYQPLAVWFHMANPGYSMPGAQLADDMLTDLDPADSTKYKLPLAITTDIVMGETTKYCDYILPDVSYLERWATPHIAPNVPITASGVRQPVLSAPLYPDTKLAEDIYIDVAKRLQLPGVYGTDGTDGFGSALPASRQSFDTAEDWYKRMIVNFALESGKVPKTEGGYYALADWTLASGSSEQLDELENTLIDYVLARGGVFENPDTAYALEDGSSSGGLNDEVGEYMRKRYGKMVNFYIERLATEENCMASSAGVYFSGIGFYDRIKNAVGDDIRTLDETEYPYMVSTYKTVLHTQSRTIANPWLTQLEGTNGVLINDEDAAALGIRNNEKIKVTSRNGSVTGNAVVTKGIMKGVVSISHNFGHTDYGADDWEENDDGSTTRRKGISKRNAGISANRIMRLDESLNDTVCLQDLIGGSACFYDTYVKIEKA
jgi:anaerobic selenocysteine-containing dehydrogenase